MVQSGAQPQTRRTKFSIVGHSSGGEFEKPRFFKYNPDICAHGASGLTGCTRCIDACPAGAIISMQDEVAVDPYKCQGAGACATACPTGAMTYVYPSVSDHLRKLAALLRAYRDSAGETPAILYYDAEAGRSRLQRLIAALPEHVIPFEVAELGSVGMDVWQYPIIRSQMSAARPRVSPGIERQHFVG